MRFRTGFGNVTIALRKEGRNVSKTRFANLVEQKLGKLIAAGLSASKTAGPIHFEDPWRD